LFEKLKKVTGPLYKKSHPARFDCFE